MHSRRLLTAGFIVVSTGGVLAAQTATHHTTNVLTAEVDCRAGCQNNFNGCQQSTKAAVFNASPGYYVDPDSIEMVRERPGSPGLRSEPKWRHLPYPTGTAKPTRIIVRPDLATCHGQHPHTQGTNWYDFEALQKPL